MLRSILRISILTLIILAVRRIARGRISKRLQYALWLVLPLYLLISPFLHIDINVPVKEKAADTVVYESVQAETPEVQTAGEPYQVAAVKTDDVSTEVSTEQGIATAQLQSNGPSKAHISFLKIIKSISSYAPVAVRIVAAALGAVAILYNAGFVIYCKRKRKDVGFDPEINLNIFRIDHSGAPFLLGRNVYLRDPSGPSGEEDYALIHEQCHFRHGDWLWTVVRLAVLIINWYNPLIWYAYMLSGHDCELACDEAVLRKIGKEKSLEYGRVLLSAMSENAKHKGIGFALAWKGNNKKMMTERLTNIKDSFGKQTVLPVLMATVILTGAVGCSLINVQETMVTDETSDIETEAVAGEEETEGSLDLEAVQQELPDGQRIILVYSPEVLEGGNTIYISSQNAAINTVADEYYYGMLNVNTLQETSGDLDGLPYNIEMARVDDGDETADTYYDITLRGSFAILNCSDEGNSFSVVSADRINYYRVFPAADESDGNISVPEASGFFYRSETALQTEPIENVSEYLQNAEFASNCVTENNDIIAIADISGNTITNVYFFESADSAK